VLCSLCVRCFLFLNFSASQEQEKRVTFVPRDGPVDVSPLDLTGTTGDLEEALKEQQWNYHVAQRTARREREEESEEEGEGEDDLVEDIEDELKTVLDTIIRPKKTLPVVITTPPPRHQKRPPRPKPTNTRTTTGRCCLKNKRMSPVIKHFMIATTRHTN